MCEKGHHHVGGSHCGSSSSYIFDEFFASGRNDASSPFITPTSRAWGKNLWLRMSVASGALWLVSLLLHLHPTTEPLAYFLLLVCYVLAGSHALIESLEDLKNFDINIDVLMTLAGFLAAFIGSPYEGALLLVLFAISGSLEESVMGKARKALASLTRLSPTKAHIFLESGNLKEASIQDIPIGTKIVVKAGEMVPLDGIVVDGNSSISTAHLTGESLPERVSKGANITAGSQNLDSSLVIETTSSASTSTFTKIINLVTEAQETKPKLQRWMDAFSKSYSITIILLSVIIAATLYFFFSLPLLGPKGAVFRALTFLIAASPCALIIAVPIAYLSAVSCCAKMGILLKGSTLFDTVAKCQFVACDKTGTLTEGEPQLEQIISLNNPIEDQELKKILSIVYALERQVVHPIATAISTYAREKNILAASLIDFNAQPGVGVSGKVMHQGKEENVSFGFIDLNQLSAEEKVKVQSLQKPGALFSLFKMGSLHLLFIFSDVVRPQAKESIDAMKKLGIQFYMLTGDKKANAESVAKATGITEFYAELKPEDKLRHISEIAEKGILAMVGDGVNDAPALAKAHIGIAMGKVGSSTATSASDIVLLSDKLELIPYLISKSRALGRIVIQNVTFAISVIIVASLLSVTGVIPLWLAVILHEGGTLLVGLNSLRLLRR